MYAPRCVPAGPPSGVLLQDMILNQVIDSYSQFVWECWPGPAVTVVMLQIACKTAGCPGNHKIQDSTRKEDGHRYKSFKCCKGDKRVILEGGKIVTLKGYGFILKKRRQIVSLTETGNILKKRRKTAPNKVICHLESGEPRWAGRNWDVLRTLKVAISPTRPPTTLAKPSATGDFLLLWKSPRTL